MKEKYILYYIIILIISFVACFIFNGEVIHYFIGYEFTDAPSAAEGNWFNLPLLRALVHATPASYITFIIFSVILMVGLIRCMLL